MSRPFPSWCVLDGDMTRDGDDYADQPPSLLRLRLVARSRQAWGFDVYEDIAGAEFDAESLVRRLKLEARIADVPNLSSISLRGASSGQRLFAFVHAVDKNLIVFTSNLPRAPGSAYIIYDTISEALTMIPVEPPCFFRTTRALIARRRAGYDDRSYALVVMAKTPELAGEDDVKGKGKMPEFDGEEFLTGEDVLMGKAKKQKIAGGEDDDGDINWQDVLLLWPSSSSSPWKLTKTANLPNKWLKDESSFVADVTFSFEGHGFWVDLLCGVLFCSCDDLLSDEVDRVDFSFIGLPPGCQADLRHTGEVTSPEAYRTMGCAGGSIRFVSIDGFLEHVTPPDRMVTVWRLLLDRNTWVKEHEVSLEDLWNQQEFDNANLSMNMTPMYPILSTEEEHVICFILGEYFHDLMGIAMPADAHYMLQVDMSRRRILSSAPLPSECSAAPIVVSSDFTSYLPPVALAGNDVVRSVLPPNNVDCHPDGRMTDPANCFAMKMERDCWGAF